MHVTTHNKPLILITEFLTLFIGIPMLLFFTASRVGIYMALWGAGIYALVVLRRAPDFSWRRLWLGDGWSRAAQRRAFCRFVVLAALVAVITAVAMPEHLLQFPLSRFWVWLLVMVLYPLLSIVPQELFFRSFYFARYSGFVTERAAGLLVNGLVFGFSHIVLNNWIAPSFCAIAGVILAHSYRQHRSLKWAVIEHSLYGCWIFTIGIGWYFFTGNWRH